MIRDSSFSNGDRLKLLGGHWEVPGEARKRLLRAVPGNSCEVPETQKGSGSSGGGVTVMEAMVM